MYQELELLLGGLPTINVEDWQANTEYAGGYNVEHQVRYELQHYILYSTVYIHSFLILNSRNISEIKLSDLDDCIMCFGRSSDHARRGSKFSYNCACVSFVIIK